MRRVSTWVAVALFVVCAPHLAYAQASIAGVVRDASGAVLPGVTVEASSPALIEGTRAVVTDGSGQYRIVDLRPGAYAVTFTLTGFRSVRREGIELTGTFTAPVNAELSVGALEETITVSGEAPIVDVQGAQSEQRISADVLASIPTGRQYFSLAALVPGMAAAGTDVGGSQGPAFTAFRSRGGSSDEGQFQVNGFPVGWQGFGISYYVADLGAAEEVAFGLSGGMGEARTGGPTLNVIPRQGGNTFAGSLYANAGNGTLEGSNFTDAHRAAGLRVPNQLNKIWDANTHFGGPLQRDKLWFFTSFRHQGNRKTVAGMWANLNAGDATRWTYDPDLSRQATDTGNWMNAAARLTWQATPRNKVSFFWDEQSVCRLCLGGEGTATSSPEATPTNEGFPQKHAQATWTSPATNRLLLEGGLSLNTVQWGGVPKESVDTTDLIRVQEQAGLIPGINYRSTNWTRPFGYTWTWRGSASYVTGSHTAKVGYEGNYYWNRQMNHTNSHLLTYRLNNGVPNQLTMTLDTPIESKAYTNDMSIYAQDQWTRGRLTVQGGVRYEHITSGFPELQVGPSRFLPRAIVFPAHESPVNMHDLAPRFGAAYDLFGNGKTAVKATFGRYVAEPSGSNYYANAYSPINRLQTSTARAWTDGNRNFVADCDLLNPLTNGECGPWANQNFGNQVQSQTFDPDVVKGWNVRMYTQDLNVGVRHELFPRVGIEIEYSRRYFGNFRVTDNRAVGPGDFDSFCLTAPSDSRLPGDVGGSQLCGLLNVKPAKFGQTDDFVTFADKFGGQTRRYQGMNFTANARMMNGVTLQGGFSTGSTLFDDCDVRQALPEIAASGSLTPYCHVQSPYLTNVSGLASYTIPRLDVQVSGTFISKPLTDARNANGNVVAGESLAANFNAPNALVQQSLGRPLSGNAANVQVNLIEPGTFYGDRIQNLDVRVAKVLRFDRRRLMVGLDVYNILNSGPVVTYNQTFGPAWLTPTAILQARFAKISAQFDF